MDFSVKKLIVSAFRQMLAPMVRMALRNGMSFGEFSDLSKSLYVEISAKEYGIKGRLTNDSRIALMTGLDRREIKRVRERLGEHEVLLEKSPSHMAKILTAWHEDETYLSDDEKPLVLALEGENPSFTQLVQEHGGDIAVVTVLREFKRSQVIEETADGKLAVVQRYYIPNYMSDTKQSPDFIDPEKISHGSSMLSDHINTVFFNLYESNESSPKRMELRATNAKVHLDRVPEFYQYADELSMDYLIKIDKWLSDNEVTDDEFDEDVHQNCERLGVGLYFIEGKNKTIE